MAPILSLLWTVFAAILEVFILCTAGYVLARKGILDKTTQKQLNRLNVSLFTPSLLFSKVAFFLSPAKMRELWIIPIFFVLVTTVSMSVSFTLGWIFRLKKSQRSFAMAAAMFMNSNSLPIALMQSLVVTVDGLKWDEDDTRSSMLGRALTYLVLYSTLGMVLRWSYGVHLLTQADPESPLEENDAGIATPASEANTAVGHDVMYNRKHVDDAQEDAVPAFTGNTEQRPTISIASSSTSQTSLSSANSNLAVPNTQYGQAKALRKDRHAKLRQGVFYSFPNTPSQSRPNLIRINSETTVGSPPRDHEQEQEREREQGQDDPEEDFYLTFRRRDTVVPSSSRFHSFFRRLSHRIRRVAQTINSFMTVPLWAALSSILVASLQPLQHLLDEHSQPIKGALTAAGNCSIPVTLIVLGAYFNSAAAGSKQKTELPRSVGDEDVDGEAEAEAGESLMGRTGYNSSDVSLVGSVRNMLGLTRWGSSAKNDALKRRKIAKAEIRTGETKTVVIAVVSRMLITPMLLLPLMALSAKYDIPSVLDDPIFVLSNVLLVASPPALTLAQITQAASGDAFERLISRTIFWAYCIVTPPATIIYVVIGLLMAKL